MAEDGASHETVPLLKSPEPENSDHKYIQLAIRAALFVNLILFSSMIATFLVSRSLAVLASLLDSTLDLMSQCIIWYSYKRSHREDNMYPAGTSRLSPVGILVCSTLMFAGALQVIWESATTFTSGLKGDLPVVEFDRYVIGVLSVAICVKVVLLCYSRYHPACARSPDVQTMAQDHFNDILTNTGALSCGYVAFWKRSLWWVDPIGAIVLALYIAYSWYMTGNENLRKLVGMGADDETLEEIEKVLEHHRQRGVEVDNVKCYHLGNNVVVEVDIVMAGELTLRFTHDVALRIQQDLEQLDVVERAYVHTDYKRRNYDEHEPSPPMWTEYVRKPGSPTLAKPSKGNSASAAWASQAVV
eukprot:GGOE01005296.1.p1 GENE.GGOE01005296.1~~GGOE01005296.1.p1  ORF type:complete len:370 (+),score=112.55 GGOE01005296.1:37-1110(+)